jgi:dUTPase
MEFTLGELAQRPERSSVYKDGFRLRALFGITIKPNKTELIRTNLYIKHANDHHIRLFMQPEYSDKLSIVINKVKSVGQVYDFLVHNISEEPIKIRKNKYIVDIISVHDVLSTITLLRQDGTDGVEMLLVSDNLPKVKLNTDIEDAEKAAKIVYEANMALALKQAADLARKLEEFAESNQ